MPTQPFIVTWPDIETPMGQISFGGELDGAGGTGFERFRTLGLHAIVLLCRGAGRYTDAQGVSSALRPGNVILVAPDTPHQYGPGPRDSWHEVFLCFRGPSFAAHLGPLLPGGLRQPVLHLGDPWPWRERLLTLLSAPAADVLGAMVAASLLHVLLGDVVRAGVGETRHSWLETAKTLMTSRLDGAMSAEEVARACGISVPTLRRRFRAATGFSPGAFRLRHKLENAAFLLRRTDLSLAMIAERCGFWDAAHFSQSFRRAYGSTPSRWRRILSLD